MQPGRKKRLTMSAMLFLYGLSGFAQDAEAHGHRGAAAPAHAMRLVQPAAG